MNVPFQTRPITCPKPHPGDAPAPQTTASNTGLFWRHVQTPIDLRLLTIALIEPLVSLFEMPAVELRPNVSPHPSHHSVKHSEDSQIPSPRSVDSDAHSSAQDALTKRR